MSLWQAKRRVEQHYQRALQSLFRTTLSAFKGMYSINQFMKKIEAYTSSDAFINFAEATSRKMITSLFDDVGKDWRSASRHNSKGRKIFELLTNEIARVRGERVEQLVDQNAELIKTLPMDVANDVVRYIERETTKGRRPEDIERDIVKLFPNKTKARAKLIARTECAKTQTALIQSDCEEVGAEWYIWHSTKDQRTRGSHARMNGVLCSWRDPPNPELLYPDKNKAYGNYHPGCTFNCRCYPEPIVTIAQLTESTYRVHQNGTIKTMKLSDVRKLISL